MLMARDFHLTDLLHPKGFIFGTQMGCPLLFQSHSQSGNLLLLCVKLESCLLQLNLSIPLSSLSSQCSTGCVSRVPKVHKLSGERLLRELKGARTCFTTLMLRSN